MVPKERTDPCCLLSNSAADGVAVQAAGPVLDHFGEKAGFSQRYEGDLLLIGKSVSVQV